MSHTHPSHPTNRFGPSALHQRDPRSSLFDNYQGDRKSRPSSQSPARLNGGYGYNAGSSSEGMNGGFRPATPNKKGQYSDAVLEELESQNDNQVEGMSAKVKMLKEVRPSTPSLLHFLSLLPLLLRSPLLLPFLFFLSFSSSLPSNPQTHILPPQKQLTVAIGDEIRDSSHLAEKMNDSFDNTRVRLRGTMKRMLRMAEKTGVGWKVWLGFFGAVCFVFWYVWLF
ncbi:protein transport protein bet1 [Varicellaria rhodocarpa]|nr:protein transport protein bet1 [Varicellaria rhodocarpa]